MSMLIVYYSLTGKTKSAAERISEAIDGDILRIVPERDIPVHSCLSIPLGVLSVMTGRKPALKPSDISPADYDTIIIGTPVWAGHYAPAVRSWLDTNDLTGKRVAFFATCGSDPGVTFEKMMRFAGHARPFGTLTLTSKDNDWDSSIAKWVKEIQSHIG